MSVVFSIFEANGEYNHCHGSYTIEGVETEEQLRALHEEFCLAYPYISDRGYYDTYQEAWREGINLKLLNGSDNIWDRGEGFVTWLIKVKNAKLVPGLVVNLYTEGERFKIKEAELPWYLTRDQPEERE